MRLRTGRGRVRGRGRRRGCWGRGGRSLGLMGWGGVEWWRREEGQWREKGGGGEREGKREKDAHLVIEPFENRKRVATKDGARFLPAFDLEVRVVLHDPVLVHFVDIVFPFRICEKQPRAQLSVSLLSHGNGGETRATYRPQQPSSPPSPTAPHPLPSPPATWSSPHYSSSPEGLLLALASPSP